MPELQTKLKEYRKEKHLQQDQLAEMVGVRRETIVKLEAGKYNPSLKLAMDISNVLGKTVEELFSFNNWEDTQNMQNSTDIEE